ncbi:MAG: hypothetical protein QQN41_11260 [Nitrosopumilus sp.]
MSLDEKSSWVHSTKTHKDEDLGFVYEMLDTDKVKQFIKVVETIMMNTGISGRERVERLHYEAGKGLI